MASLADFQKKVIQLTNAQLRLIQDYNIRSKAILKNKEAVQELIGFVKDIIRTNAFSSADARALAASVRRVDAEIDNALSSLQLEESLGTHEFVPLKDEEATDETALRMLETEVVSITKSAELLPKGAVKSQLMDFLARLREQKSRIQRELEINQYLEAILGNYVPIVLEEHELLNKQKDILKRYAFDTLTEDVKVMLSEMNREHMELANRLEALVQKEKKEFIDPFKTFTDQKYEVNRRIAQLSAQPVITKEAIKQDLRSLSPVQAEEYLRLLDKQFHRFEPTAIRVMQEAKIFGDRFANFFRAKKDIMAQRKEYALERDLTMAQRRASVDPLTNAYTRGFFDDQYPLRIQAGMRRGVVSFLIFDIDKFKSVNDTYGHDVGDWVLSQVVLIAKQSLRSGDLLFRLGGEEFVVLFETGTQHNDAVGIAERIRKAIEEESLRTIQRSDDPLLEKIKAHQRAITISGGVATVNFLKDVQLSPDDVRMLAGVLKRRADEKLYEAKTGGRNRILSSVFEYLPVD